jgi:hypothetical protein
VTTNSTTNGGTGSERQMLSGLLPCRGTACVCVVSCRQSDAANCTNTSTELEYRSFHQELHVAGALALRTDTAGMLAS